MAGKTQRPGGIIEGINVTPLVDITLVLLVIFIVTAKIVVAPAVPLDLPHASKSEAVQTVFTVAVEPDGTARVGGEVVDLSELEREAARALAGDASLRAVIAADRAVSHGRVMAVLDALRAAGLERVAFGAAAGDDATAEDETP